MLRRGRWLACAIVVLALIGADAAAASSIVYIKGGNVQVAGPDGSGAHAITSNGNWQWPSQADDGTIVAVHREANERNTVGRLYRFDHSGRQIGQPVAAGQSNSSTFNAPIAEKVSPNGQLVAYTYFYGALHGDSPAIAFAPLDRDSNFGDIGEISGYLNPSWYDDGHVVAFGGPSLTQDTLIKTPDHQNSTAWFQDDSVRLVDGELDRSISRFVALASDGRLLVYQLNGAPPAAPTAKCQLTPNPGQEFANPSFSPDGKQIAFEAGGSIYIWNLASLDACDQGTTALAIAGATDPDWGPADAGGGAGGGPAVTASVARTKLRTALRKGLKVKVKS